MSVFGKRIYDVSGRIILPGTRKVEMFSARLMAEDMRQGSLEMTSILNKKYREKLPRGKTFSPNFALMNLSWKEIGTEIPTEEIEVLKLMGVKDNSPPMKNEEEEDI